MSFNNSAAARTKDVVPVYEFSEAEKRISEMGDEKDKSLFKRVVDDMKSGCESEFTAYLYAALMGKLPQLA